MAKRSKDSGIVRLKRFTTLPILPDLLERKNLILLNPELWDDKNDSAVILSYKQKEQIKNLFSVCMSYGDETVHGWKTFFNGTSGCVIEFNTQKLFDAIKHIPGLRHGKVAYRKLSDVEKEDSVIDIEKNAFYQAIAISLRGRVPDSRGG